MLLPHRLRKKFLKRVAHGAPSDCWPWLGYVAKSGYGQYSVNTGPNGALGKRVRDAHGVIVLLAHRVAYELYNYTSIPKGVFVCHRCNNTRCCNPAHLYLGNARDNAEDMRLAGTIPAGEKSGMSKLTHQQVENIRRLYATGSYTQSVLGSQFGITRSTVGAIVRGETWGRSSVTYRHRNARFASHNSQTKVTKSLAHDINAAWLSRKFTRLELSRRFHLSCASINRVIKRKSH
jgi:hypothetical protein